MNFDDPRNQGLLALAAGLMAPSRGGSFGGAAAQGLQGYQQAYGNASNVQAQQEQMQMMREQYAAKKSAAEKAQQTQETLKKLSGMLIGSIGTPGQAPQLPQQAARPSPQEASGLYQPPPMMGEMPAMTQGQIEQSFDARQAQNRADMGLPSGGYGQMQPAASNGKSEHQRQLLAQIALLDPDVAEKLQNIIMPKPEKLVFQDGNAMDPYTGQVKSKYDPRPPTFNPMTNLIRSDGTINEALYNAQKGLRAAGKNEQTIHVGEKMSPQNKKFQEKLADVRIGIMERGNKAADTIAGYQAIGDALKNAPGGSLEGVKKDIASFLTSFGVNIDPELANKEFAEAVGLGLAQDMRKPGEGTFTDKDFATFMRRVPDLTKTPEGRQQIIAYAIAKAERDQVIANMAEEYAANSPDGGIDEKFMRQAREYANANPIRIQPVEASRPVDAQSAAQKAEQEASDAQRQRLLKKYGVN